MLNDKDNEQLTHHLAQLLVDNPGQYLVEVLSLIQAKLMCEVVSQLEKTIEIQIAKLDEKLIKHQENRG